MMVGNSTKLYMVGNDLVDELLQALAAGIGQQTNNHIFILIAQVECANVDHIFERRDY